MAAPRTLKFGDFKIWIEDPDNPGVFIAPCGFTQKALTITGSTSDVVIPDCDDPDAAAWVGRGIASLSAEFNGSGVFALDGHAKWRKRMLAAASFPVRVEFADTGANGGGYYSGNAVLTTLGEAVQRGADGGKTTANVAGQSDGAWIWTDNA
jgi:hypothetical protein